MRIRGKGLGWTAGALLALPGLAWADGGQDAVAAPAAKACSGTECCDALVVSAEDCASDECCALAGQASPTELGALFRQIADRIEGLEAQVAYAVQTAEEARGPLTGAPVAVASRPAQVEVAQKDGLCNRQSACGTLAVSTHGAHASAALEAADPAVLASVVSAEARLAELNDRIAAMEAREAEIVANIEASLAEADAVRAEMVADLQTRTLELKDMWTRQAGKVDFATTLGGFHDTMMSMDLPALMAGLASFSQNFDQIAGTGMQPLLEEWSAQTQDLHLGSGLVDAGRQLEGVTLGDLLLGMSEQTKDMPMPPELAQGLMMAQSFGVQNFLPMLKSNLRDASLGSLFAPLAQQMQGVQPAEMFYGMADQCPGQVLPALAMGLGDSLEGLDLAYFFQVLSEELAPVDARTLLLGVDKLLRGETPSVVLATMGEKLVDVDLGHMLMRLGYSLEDVSVSNTMFRMSTELEGLTVAQVLDEVQRGLNAAGVPVDLPTFLRHSGEHLARTDMPARMQGFQGLVGQLSSYTDEVRREMGLYPYGEPDFWVEDVTESELAQRESEMNAILDTQIEELAAEVESLDATAQEASAELSGAFEQAEFGVGQKVDSAEVQMESELDAELRRTRLALDDLRAAGLTDEHPAMQKLQARLEGLLTGSAGGN